MSNTPDIDRLVWETVRRGDRKGTVVTPSVVYERTGMWISAQECLDAVGRLLKTGAVYWRSPWVRRRLLPGVWPTDPPKAARHPKQLLFDDFDLASGPKPYH